MLWYKFDVKDYLFDTLHLPDAHDLAYRRLIDYYYMNEGPIPLDVNMVSRKIRIDLDIVEDVLREFFTYTDQGYRHKRCDDELFKYLGNANNSRTNGSKGGRPPKTAEENPAGSQQEPSSNLNKNKNKNKKEHSAKFEEFWSTWPSSKRKVGKDAVWKKWDDGDLDEISDKIISHVKILKVSQQWLEGWEPAPLTYINQKRWLDGDTGYVDPTGGRRTI